MNVTGFVWLCFLTVAILAYIAFTHTRKYIRWPFNIHHRSYQWQYKAMPFAMPFVMVLLVGLLEEFLRDPFKSVPPYILLAAVTWLSGAGAAWMLERSRDMIRPKNRPFRSLRGRLAEAICNYIGRHKLREIAKYAFTEVRSIGQKYRIMEMEPEEYSYRHGYSYYAPAQLTDVAKAFFKYPPEVGAFLAQYTFPRVYQSHSAWVALMRAFEEMNYNDASSAPAAARLLSRAICLAMMGSQDYVQAQSLYAGIRDDKMRWLVAEELYSLDSNVATFLVGERDRHNA